ncbi:hypothetical protein, partial [Myroides sp. LoEW2-1]|uniref:hypothetical protein n=1 Tax=Myroides sp. LoEW2-1 TaxID=2683192 RepID=UPI001AA10455
MNALTFSISKRDIGTLFISDLIKVRKVEFISLSVPNANTFLLKGTATILVFAVNSRKNFHGVS